MVASGGDERTLEGRRTEQVKATRKIWEVTCGRYREVLERQAAEKMGEKTDEDMVADLPVEG